MASKQTAKTEETKTTTPPMSMVGRKLANNVKTEKVEAFDRVDVTFAPGKEGFLEGETLAGHYVESRTVVSPKLINGSRDLHVLRDLDGALFGIWGVGQLNSVLPRLARNQYVTITLTGKAEKALKAGQSPPYQFNIESDQPLLPSAPLADQVQ